MPKRLLCLALIALFGATLAAAPGMARTEDSWTGEIVEKACFVDRGLHGPDHASCAKRCLSRGGEMGLLTDDGTLVLLIANPDDDSAFEALKDLAGAKATVSGTAAEQDGMTVVTVLEAEAAD